MRNAKCNCDCDYEYKYEFLHIPVSQLAFIFFFLLSKLRLCFCTIFLLFLNSIIATLSAYRGRYADYYYSIALLLVVYILGNWRQCCSRGPYSVNFSSFFHCQRRVECNAIVADLNWSISPSDFMNWAAFLANLGLVSISSQFILPNAIFLRSSSYILFFFWVCKRHSISKCFADCRPRLQGDSDES